MMARKLLFLAKVVSLAAVYFGVARLGLLLAFMLGHNTLQRFSFERGDIPFSQS